MTEAEVRRLHDKIDDDMGYFAAIADRVNTWCREQGIEELCKNADPQHVHAAVSGLHGAINGVHYQRHAALCMQIESLQADLAECREMLAAAWDYMDHCGCCETSCDCGLDEWYEHRTALLARLEPKGGAK